MIAAEDTFRTYFEGKGVNYDTVVTKIKEILPENDFDMLKNPASPGGLGAIVDQESP